MRVAAKALSVFCPHCQKRATLENLRIVGTHPGRSLATCGDILVEAASQLNVEIVANNVKIKGRVNGHVSANECLEVESTGRIYGDVKAAKLIVRDGGVIQGRIEMIPTPGARSAHAKDGGATAAEHSGDVPATSHGHGLPAAPALLPGRTPLPKAPQQIRPIRLE